MSESFLKSYEKSAIASALTTSICHHDTDEKTIKTYYDFYVKILKNGFVISTKKDFNTAINAIKFAMYFYSDSVSPFNKRRIEKYTKTLGNLVYMKDVVFWQ